MLDSPRKILNDVALLNAADIARALQSLFALRAHWTPRQSLPFYTLGAASYLDASGGFAAYRAGAERTNPILAEHFGWLHDRLCAVVSERVGEEAVCDARLALPGFHVFLFDPAIPYPPASVHYDMQYEPIDWTGIGTPDVTTQLSLTLTLALPAAGGGLLVWNINRLDLDRMTPDERRSYTYENRVATFHPYTVGHLVVHSGHQLHQIAAAPDATPDDRRITLQAHAIRVDGRWLVYW